MYLKGADDGRAETSAGQDECRQAVQGGVGPKAQESEKQMGNNKCEKISADETSGYHAAA